MESWFKTTEAWLYSYKVWIAEIRSWQIEQFKRYSQMPSLTAILRQEGTVQTSKVSDSTQQWAIARTDFPNNVEMPQNLKEKYIKAAKMQAALSALTARERRIYELKYVEEWRDVHIWTELESSKSAFYRSRYELVRKVATILGLKNHNSEGKNAG